MAFAKKQTTGPTYQSIVSDVKAGQIAPIYYLMGEEAYYIDRLCDFLTAALMPNEEDRDFNLITLFGPDTSTDAIISAAKGFPMMGERILIIVKEAQALKDIDKLEYYLKQPSQQNVIVFCHKNGTIDRRKKVATLIAKVGVLFESAKPNDRELLTFIDGYVKSKNLKIEPRAHQMIAEYVGADLLRISSEIDKLALSLPSGADLVTSDLVTNQIGISKQFNIFEFQDAIGRKDVKKVNEIAKYFDKDQKNTPIQMILPSLYKYFANLMQAYYSPNHTEAGIAAHLGMSDWQVKRNILPPMQRYSGIKCMQILGAIRRTDAKSKGIDNPDTPPGELMKELIYFILH